jgi:hypothetical protein
VTSRQRRLNGGWIGGGGCAVLAVAVLWATAWPPRPLGAQRGGMFLGSPDDPAIAYASAPLDNVVDDLNRRLLDGSVRLAFEGRAGYLASALDALALPADSQLLLFSKGSLQARSIDPTNPRALFFNDRVALGWVRDGDLLEVAAHDARAGVVYYTLEQRPTERPVFKREFRCLGCHVTGDTLGVPGLLMFSSTPDGADDRHVQVEATDQRSPMARRFGGWFVTASRDAGGHLGNRVPALARRPAGSLPSVAGLFDPDGYRATTSDIAALLTFAHQTHMTNLLTRASWDARAVDPTLHPGAATTTSSDAVALFMRVIATEVVDYLLFVDEAPLPGPVRGGSGFAERMSARGPRDRRGRSLYELDLTRRLLKYPCSYLVYSPAFDALPPLVKTPIYERLWHVLSGQADDPRYRTLARDDRQAVLEILKDTKPDLPAYFTTTVR